MKWIDGTDLEQWADRRDSQSILPELVRRLVYATVPDPRRVDFRSGEGVQLPGWDGYLEAPIGTVHAPEGISCWEMGTDQRIVRKANEDYDTRSQNPLGVDRRNAAFIFVTPRRWSQKAEWLNEKNTEDVWREVRAFDADDLEAWLLQAPAVGAWLARHIGKHPQHVTDLENFWNEFTSSTNPPLTAMLLLADRGTEQTKVVDWLKIPPTLLQISVDTDSESVAFLAACVSELPESERQAMWSSAVVTDDAEALRALSLIRTCLTIAYRGDDRTPVANVCQRGHRVLAPLQFGAKASTNSIILPRPSRGVFAEALKATGYPEAEASAIARETGRSIGAFRRRFGIARSLGPDWAQPPHVHDLIGMLFAGSWDDRRTGDRNVLAALVDKPYYVVDRLAASWCQGVDLSFAKTPSGT